MPSLSCPTIGCRCKKCMQVQAGWAGCTRVVRDGNFFCVSVYKEGGHPRGFWLTREEAEALLRQLRAAGV